MSNGYQFRIQLFSQLILYNYCMNKPQYVPIYHFVLPYQLSKYVKYSYSNISKLHSLTIKNFNLFKLYICKRWSCVCLPYHNKCFFKLRLKRKVRSKKIFYRLQNCKSKKGTKRFAIFIAFLHYHKYLFCCKNVDNYKLVFQTDLSLIIHQKWHYLVHQITIPHLRKEWIT